MTHSFPTRRSSDLKDPYSAFSVLLDMYNNSKVDKSGREEFSFVSDSAAMGEDCYIGAFSYLGEHVKLGRNVKVFPQVYIGDNCVIGDDTILHPGVKIYAGCQVEIGRASCRERGGQYV